LCFLLVTGQCFLSFLPDTYFLFDVILVAYLIVHLFLSVRCRLFHVCCSIKNVFIKNVFMVCKCDNDIFFVLEQPDAGEDAEFVRAKYFFRDEFLVKDSCTCFLELFQ